MKRNLNMMIKPSSSKCNLNCVYCFYNKISEKREVCDYGYMDEETIKIIVKKAKEYCNGGICTIGFQGGEPLLIGKKFYKSFIDAIEDSNNGTRFNLTIQTNGILIDEEWAKFFKGYNFLVGVSIDGTKALHNKNRMDKTGTPTYSKVLEAIEILKKYDVHFNILTVLTNELAEKIKEVYDNYKKLNFRYIQFIPQLDEKESALSVKVYKKFLIELFNLWYEDIKLNNKVSIRYFDNILGALNGHGYEACEMRGICSCQNIIEANGSVYPCDFYSDEKHQIGNIKENTFEELMSSSKTISFMKKSLYMPEECYNCKYVSLCRNGCERYRDSNNKKNVFCDAYYNFFEYICTFKNSN